MDSLDKIRELIDSTLLLKTTDFAIVIKHHLSQAEKEFEDWKKRSVSWDVSDFEWRAKDVHGADWEKYFDKDLFEEALIAMIHQHDATIGITWDTIDAYLEYCKR